MREKFAPRLAGVIDGRTKKAERAEIIARFKAVPGLILLAHMRSIAEGLNLQMASRVYLPEPSFSPADNEQLVARAYRRGQTRDVHATFMYVPGTPDARVAAALLRKLDDRDARRRMLAAEIL
jgi:superfamily II DNA or RNA helicase